MTGTPVRPVSGRAVDRPGFWWAAGAVFLVNAGISAWAGQWAVAVLQLLTCVWASVAGVSARDEEISRRRESRPPGR